MDILTDSRGSGPLWRVSYLLLLIVVAASLMGAATAYGASINSKGKSKGVEGELAPGIDLEVMGKGGERGGLSDYSGKVVVVNFLASWCVACKRELPDLLRLSNEYRDRGLQVIGVAPDNEERLRGMLEELSSEGEILEGEIFPILLDRYGKVMKRYGVVALPLTVIINEKGYVVERYVGEQSFTSGRFLEAVKRELKKVRSSR